MTLQTKRLYIRNLSAEDWPHFRRIAADFTNSPYAIYDRPLPIQEDQIQTLCSQFAQTELWFAVLRKEEMIGYICFHKENDTTYDIGYCFLTAYHGKGYAYESCKAVLDYIKQTKRITKFTSGTALQNKPSCKLLVKLGFVLRATENLSFYQDANGNDIVFDSGIFDKVVGDSEY